MSSENSLINTFTPAKWAILILLTAVYSSCKLTNYQKGELLRCYSAELLAERLNDPAFKSRYDSANIAIDQYLRTENEYADKEGGFRSGVVRIPVVVHVVYNTAAQDLTEAQVQTQINVLNQDYRRTNADASSLPAAFTSLAADCQIEFALAKRDPSCNATNGITHRSTTTTNFYASTDNVKSVAGGGDDPWPRDKYLNIWVCPSLQDHPAPGSHNLLGYGTFPGEPAATDGLVVLRAAFGDASVATDPNYNRGRTSTHEIGHVFNLRHIWGDDNGLCTGSDEVDDTPNQGDKHFGCPSFPFVSCSNGPNGDMFMNYMDYVDDNCMYVFTQGQANRANAALNTTRNSLLASDALIPPTGPSAADLCSLDSHEDVGNEPNNESPWMYISDDIWIRNTNDGITDQTHQNPHGASTNFVYVRVRNRSCGSSAPPATVKLYWAKASSGLGWPAPWDGTVTSPALMGGLIGTQATSTIAAGSSQILVFSWPTPDPADYASFGADKGHFCLLSRIETSSVSPFGMTVAEGSNLWDNVKNNNNIVWKNVEVVPSMGGMREAYIIVNTYEKRDSLYTLQFTQSMKSYNVDFSKYGTVSLQIGKLYEDWKNGGAKQKGFEVKEDQFTLVGNSAQLMNIKLDPKEFYVVKVTFVPNPKRPPLSQNFEFDLTQIKGQTIVGGQRFIVNAPGFRQ